MSSGLIVLIVFIIFAIVAGVIWGRQIRTFYQEVLVELKKASWPNRKELKEMTLVVIIAVALLGAYVSLADFALFNFVDLFTGFVRPESGS